MYTLGLWGFSADKPDHLYHDTGATIVKDGEVIAAINEERMSRIKVLNGFPFASIEECLKIAGIEYKDIDQVAMTGQPPVEEMLGKRNAFWQEFRRGGHNLSTKVSLLGRVYQYWRRSKPSLAPKFHHKRLPPEEVQDKPFEWVPHHISHATTAYLCSPFERAVILTLDGSDSAGGAGLVGIGEPDTGMKFTDSVLETNSLALVYAKITGLLGFKPLRHEGKVLGLAAYEDPAKLRPVFDARGGWIEDDGWWHIPGLTQDIMRRRPPTLSKIFAGQNREAIAAALQDFVEEMTCLKVQHIYRTNPQWQGLPLVVAGGLFANVKLNQRILALPEVSNIYVHPNMGDAGLATGAALYADAQKRNDWRPKYMKTAYLGTNIDTSAATAACAATNIQCQPFSEESGEQELVETVASALAEGKVIARAQGSMEYGPRALGNRSIIAKADDPSINDWLNNQLERSEFMPFAPMVMAEHAKEYFPDYKDEHYAARFMTITYDASDKAKKEIPAAIHVDGTARPQIVYKEDNPEMHAILSAYYNKTGVASVINTSFNMHEEPIVRTAEEAITAAKQANLGGLILGGCWLTKEELLKAPLEKSTEVNKETDDWLEAQ